ncbi:MAG TPA: methyltransferase [Methylocystis sp.]|jgi:protein-S-isoprenylcysteine O-methyltransferase Ste14
MNAQIGANTPPSRMPWPPILMGLTLAAGLALDSATHVSLIDRASASIAQAAGAAIVSLALANDVWCFRTLSRHQTTIMPHRAASFLVSAGPFRFSRNPIYISHVALIFGLGLFLGSPFTRSGSGDRADEAGDRTRRAASSREIWRRLSVLYGAHAAVALS